MQAKLIELLNAIPEDSLQVQEVAKEGLRPGRTIFDPNVFVRIEAVWQANLEVVMDYFGRKAAALSALGRETEAPPAKMQFVRWQEAAPEAMQGLSEMSPATTYHLYCGLIDVLRKMSARVLPASSRPALGQLTLRTLVGIFEESQVALPLDRTVLCASCRLLQAVVVLGCRLEPADLYCLTRYLHSSVVTLDEWQPSEEDAVTLKGVLIGALEGKEEAQ